MVHASRQMGWSSGQAGNRSQWQLGWELQGQVPGHSCDPLPAGPCPQNGCLSQGRLGSKWQLCSRPRPLPCCCPAILTLPTCPTPGCCSLTSCGPISFAWLSTPCFWQSQTGLCGETLLASSIWHPHQWVQSKRARGWMESIALLHQATPSSLYCPAFWPGTAHWNSLSPLQPK